MPRRKKIEEPIEEVKKIKTPPQIRGMKDTLPSDFRYWRAVKDAFNQLAYDFSFVSLDVPTLERYELYAHTIGKNSEIVKQGLLWFQDRNEKAVLRPDLLPGIARSYIEHNLTNQTGPNKYWYQGKVFMQEKVSPVKSRELTQVGFSVFNAPSPSVDAELIMMVYQTLVQFGLNPEVKVNSIGCMACRSKYSKALSLYIKSKRSAVCADCRANASKDPLRFLNCANQKCQKAVEDAPQIVDFLCESCHDHLFKVLENLDDLKVQYVLEAKLVDVSNYYNSTVFEIYNKPAEDKDGKSVGDETERLLAWGGRMNYLVEMLGGPVIPAVTVNMYVEKVISALRGGKIEALKSKPPHVYLTQLSEQAKREAMAFIDELRHEDFRVIANFSKDTLKSQLDTANKSGAKLILIIGQKEVTDGTVLLRDAASGIQEVVSRKKIVNEIKKKLREMD
jgi:histidyl-tRNA synthetase